LQNVARLGSDVGLAYQSPPPLYTSKASLMLCPCDKTAQNTSPIITKPYLIVLILSILSPITISL
jgi:hypothetical protein